MSPDREGASAIIALVVAMGENRAIGRGGDLPWHLHSDMRYFRKVTMGKPIIMGRLTFKSLGRALDGRVNIVLTRDRDFTAPGAVMAACSSFAIPISCGAALRRSPLVVTHASLPSSES